MAVAPRLSRWRTLGPDDASMGLAPQSAANDASLRIRWGLSPAATSSAEATSAPTPQVPSSAGLARSHSASSSASSPSISAVSARWRLASARSARLAAPAAGSPAASRRHRAQTLTISGVLSPRSRSLRCSGAVTATALIWLAATVRALTAERRASDSVRIASTHPSADLGTAVASPLSAARAAVSASTVSVLRAAAPRLAVRAVHLHHLDAGRGEVPGEARTVPVPSTPTRPTAPQDSQPASWSRGNRPRTPVPSSRPAASTAAATMNVFVGVDPAEDSGSVWCHNGDASSGIAPMCGTTGRMADRTRLVFIKAPMVTSARPVGARPAAAPGRQITVKAPEGHSRGKGQTRPAARPHQYECRGWFCEELATNITDTVMRTADLSVGTESAHRSSISGSPSEPLFMSVQRFARSQDRSCA